MRTKTIELQEIKVNTATICIEGTSDLCLNKMNRRNQRSLLAEDRKKIKEVPNKWEDVITQISWANPIPDDIYNTADEAMMLNLLKENAPCISAFGLKKSFCQAVVRNEIDKYSTKFDNCMNVSAPRNLVPIKFASWALDERLMSPKKGSPVSVALNIFSGWSAEFQINYTEHVYSLDQIVNIINLAGFGLGIGSGRTSGYGRYKIVNVK